MDLGLTHVNHKNEQCPGFKKKKRLGLFIHALRKQPQIVHQNKTGYKYNTTLPIHPILNFSTILCTKYQPLEMTSPTTMSFPAELHAVLGLQVTFFITMVFLTHFLPNFFKIRLSWGYPMLIFKYIWAFLLCITQNTSLWDLSWHRAKKLAYSAYWIH